MPLRLQTVDPQTVALVRGPIALFGVDDLSANFSFSQLLAASAADQSSVDWTGQADARKVTFRPLLGSEMDPIASIRRRKPRVTSKFPEIATPAEGASIPAWE